MGAINSEQAARRVTSLRVLADTHATVLGLSARRSLPPL